MDMNEKQSLLKLNSSELEYYPNFITFEGGEGSGKSTVLRAVAQKLSDAGEKVFITREPGGTGSEKAEAIRQLILSDTMAGMTPLTEAFLYAASRAQHVQEVIKPNLDEGVIVLADRYVDSSIVYQGMAWKKVPEIIQLNMIAIQEVMPKHTFFFDVKPEIGLERVFSMRKGEINHLDMREMSFHQKIYEDYQQLAKIFSNRYICIDASQTIEAVVENVYEKIVAIVAGA